MASVRKSMFSSSIKWSNIAVKTLSGEDLISLKLEVFLWAVRNGTQSGLVLNTSEFQFPGFDTLVSSDNFLKMHWKCGGVSILNSKKESLMEMKDVCSYSKFKQFKR